MNIHPYNILALTFTNKAANEMKERVTNLVGDIANDMWIGTFHAICVRILRKFIDRLGFQTSFVIFDTSDQKTMIKQIIKAQNLDDKIFSDKSVLYEISNAKNEMLDNLLKVRKYFAYGDQIDYFNSTDIIGFVRKGDDEHPDSGLAVVMTDKNGGSIEMNLGEKLANSTFYDCTGNIEDTVNTDENGNGVFSCKDGSCSVWIKKTEYKN